MKPMNQKSKSVSYTVILFLLLLAVQVVMYGNFFKELKSANQVISDLSRVRGSIQRYAKLELSNVNTQDLNLESYIDGLITRQMNNPHAEELNRIAKSYDLSVLNAKWGELKSLIKAYHASPNSKLLSAVIDKSEECWTIADSQVVGQQYLVNKTTSYYKYFTITFGINLLVIAVILLLYKKYIYNNLASSAVLDSLTGIFNKGYFNEFLEHEIARAARKQISFCLIMFDIDHFKHVNDTYGHSRGDYALKTLAGVVRKCKRNADVLARIGGEEFIVLLPDTGLPDAVLLAERIRKSVEDFPFEEIGRMTVSLGVTDFRQTDDNEAILKRVDSAMYLAKENGRNRCEVIGREENNEQKSYSDRT